jgi:sulfur carrier protein
MGRPRISPRCARLHPGYGQRNEEIAMSQTAVQANIRVNGQDEPLGVATLAALLQEKAVDGGKRGIAVALNGAVIPRAAWPQTPLRPGDRVEIVRVLQGG